MPEPTHAHQPISRMAGGGIALLSLCANLLSSLSTLWMLGFVWNLPLSPTIVSAPPGMDAFSAFLINSGLILLFGLQHSVMARESFKSWLCRFINPLVERSVYIIASSLVLVLILWFWQPLPGLLWDFSTIPAAYLMYGVGTLALILVAWATLSIGATQFMGISDAKAALTGRTEKPVGFITPQPYRIVRHPMQLGTLIFIWATPLMSTSHLMFASAMTLYIVIGLYFEERALIGEFGEKYRDYKQQVPALIPRLYR